MSRALSIAADIHICLALTVLLLGGYVVAGNMLVYAVIADTDRVNMAGEALVRTLSGAAALAIMSSIFFVLSRLVAGPARQSEGE